MGDAGLVTLPADSRLSLGIASLSVAEAAGGGRIDLGAGELAIAAGGITAEQLRADLVAGRGDGSWNGATGIISAAAAAAGGTRAAGYLVAADGSARVSFAAPGDTNLDGAVDLLDLLAMLGSGTYDTTATAVWSQGDFNYDGATDLLDLLGILGSGTYDQGPSMPAATAPFGTVAAVPEPCLLWSMVMVPTTAVLVRWRPPRRRCPRRSVA